MSEFNTSGTAAVWAGEENLFAEGAICLPVFNSVTFGYDDMDEWFDVALGRKKGHIYSRNTNPTVACGSATISYSASDGVLAGTGNVDFGDPEQVPSPFVDHGNGDLRLTATGVTLFGDVALWQAGDPAADIDGAARPTTPDSADVAGVDLGP